MPKTAVITGASAGIGAATAVRLAREGFDVVLGARRTDRLEKVARSSGGTALPLDVADPGSVRNFCAAVERADVLVNNAGLALGLDPLSELSDEAAATMWEVNVMGVIRMTRELLPKIEAACGHVVNVASTAGFETYRGGGGYTASKHALRAITQTLRLELLGKPVRVTEIAPGLVETEFSLVRFGGDPAAAKRPYEGIEPLTAEDVADCIAWAVTRPPRVDIDQIVVRPIAQARSTEVARKRA
ncbi:MAG: SDR family NAD(P)-dependent oxidoreductase [Actinomycetota bacterium]